MGMLPLVSDGGGEGAAQRRHRRLAAERGQVGADEARRDAR